MSTYYQIQSEDPQFTKENIDKPWDEKAVIINAWRPLNRAFIRANEVRKFKTRAQAEKALPALQKAYPDLKLEVAELSSISFFSI